MKIKLLKKLDSSNKMFKFGTLSLTILKNCNIDLLSSTLMNLSMNTLTGKMPTDIDFRNVHNISQQCCKFCSCKEKLLMNLKALPLKHICKY